MNKSKAILALEHLMRNSVYNMLKMLHLHTATIHPCVAASGNKPQHDCKCNQLKRLSIHAIPVTGLDSL